MTIEELDEILRDINDNFNYKETIKVPLRPHIKDNVYIEGANLEPINIIKAFLKLSAEIENRKEKALLTK